MKERLHGLLALVLCMAMAFAPVSGALADGNPCVVYAQEDQIRDESIQLGDLIQSNVSLTSNYSGGQVRYYEGLYGDEAEYKEDIVDYWRLIAIKETGEPTDPYEQNQWMVAKKGNTEYIDGWIGMERVGRFVDKQELDGNKILLVMQDLQTVDSNMEMTVGERMKALEDEAFRAGYNPDVDFYQMSIYDKDKPVNNVMRRSAEQSVGRFVTVELPYPAGYNQNNSTPDDYALFHLKAGGSIEKLPVILGSESIKVQVKEFSPYALAYRQLKNDGASGGEGGSEDGGEGSGGEGGSEDGGEGSGEGGGQEGIPDGSSDRTDSLPQTGDNSRLALWFAFACAALAGLAAIRIRRRKYIG